MSDNITISKVWSIATGESLSEPEDFLVGESENANADKVKSQPEKVVGEEEVNEPGPSARPPQGNEPYLRENGLGGGANMQNRNEDGGRQHMVMFNPYEPFRDLISIEWDNLLPISPHSFMPIPLYGMPASPQQLERIVAEYDREMLPIFQARSGHIFHYGPRDPVFAANGFHDGARCQNRMNNMPIPQAEQHFAQNNQGFDFMH